MTHEKRFSWRRLVLSGLCAATLTCSVYAAEMQQQGGQNPPTPQPSPAPQPRQPNVIPAPQPTAPQNEIRITGRVMTDVHTGGPPILEIRFETDGGQPIGFAYADSTGQFTFQKMGVPSDQTLYVVVNLEGYKPYRERVFGTSLAIFLDRETTTTAPARGGTPVVDLKQLKAKVPGKAFDEYEKAMKEASKGNRVKAVDGLQRAVKLAPDFYEAQHTLGVQYLALQKYDEAETALVRARDLSPKAAEPLMNLGTLYYQRAEAEMDARKPDEAAASFKKAAEVLDDAIRQNPLSAPAHSTLGAALYKTGDFEGAETTLKKALELDDHEENARLMLVNVFTKTGRYREALDQVNIFIANNPKAPQRPSIEAIKQQIEKVLAAR